MMRARIKDDAEKHFWEHNNKRLKNVPLPQSYLSFGKTLHLLQGKTLLSAEYVEFL